MRLVRAPQKADTADLPPVEDRWQPTEVAAGYDDERFSSVPGRAFNRLSQAAVRRALAAIPGGADRLLDIPCGTGRMTAVAREFANEVVGADISPAMLDEARRRLVFASRLSLVEADILHQPFADGSFDCVTCIRLMMHLDAPQRRAALRELARVARRYVLVEYGCLSPWLRARRAIKATCRWMRGRPQRWVRGVTRSEALDDLHAAGLTLVHPFHTAWGLSESVMLLLRKS